MQEDNTVVSPLSDFAKRVKNEALPILELATFPILRFPTESPKLDRTGTFIRIGDAHFILTCSHGLESRVEKSVPLAVLIGLCEEPFVPLHDSTFLGTETDVRDVAAIRLPQTTADALYAAGRLPVGTQDINRGDPVKPGIFLIFGYPQDWFNIGPGVLRHFPITYLADMYTPDAALIAELAEDREYGMPYLPDFHGMFRMKSQGIRMTDGKRVPLPDFKGMQGISGCGIWRLCDASYEAMLAWNPTHCKLAAIEHRYDAGNGFVHATWIGVALRRITDEFPSLERDIIG